MNNELLKPCPYCGSNNCNVEMIKYTDATWRYYGYCYDCETCGPSVPESEGVGIAEVEAAERWNSLPRRVRFEKNDCAPEEPGNYWFRHPDWNAGAPIIVECYHSPNPPEMTGERIVNVAGREYHIDYDDANFFEGGEWAGPIPEPEDTP